MTFLKEPEFCYLINNKIQVLSVKKTDFIEALHS